MTIDFLIGINLAWYLLPILFMIIVLAIGSFVMSQQFYLKSISKFETQEKNVAITFDDGPNSKYTPQVLSILKDYNAKGTFFCIGKNVEKNPELLRKIKAEGHAIGNHTYSHKNSIGFSSTDKWLAEIKETDDSIQRLIKLDSNLFRPPFGVTTPNLANALKLTEHIVIGWDVRSFDTILKNPDSIVRKIKRKIRPGSIILLHDNHPNITTILEQLLGSLIELNYKPVTIPELLNEN